ncbi:MAG: aromatic-ring-hydroxylating dioxygenase subunit beta [Cycloclasticus sp.]|nr:aromatic-ring-hydroxylating dioxygenase subunit beta [Cycloclasticus sp.]
MNLIPAKNDIYLDLQRRLFQEARILSAELYDEWLADILSDDIYYRMDMPQRRFREDKSGQRAPAKTPIFNDDLSSLKVRIGRYDTGFVWAENPMNASRHIISNVEVFEMDEKSQFKVYSIVELHRSRLNADRKRFTVGREDIWVKSEKGYQLLERLMTLDDSVVLDSNMNFFL